MTIPAPAPAPGGDLLPRLLLALSAVTGLVDAASYLALGHVFTANMTGNVVLLGFAAAGASGLSVVRSGAALAAFVAGAWIGGRMSARLAAGPRHRWVGLAFGAESALLFAGTAAAQAASGDFAGQPRLLFAVIGSTALAMGLRYSTVVKLGVPDVNATVLTGTIATLAAGTHPRAARGAASVAWMFVGAAAGTLLIAHSLVVVLGLAAAISGACAAVAFFGLPRG